MTGKEAEEVHRIVIDELHHGHNDFVLRISAPDGTGTDYGRALSGAFP
jgi:hypothetical protein